VVFPVKDESLSTQIYVRLVTHQHQNKIKANFFSQIKVSRLTGCFVCGRMPQDIQAYYISKPRGIIWIEKQTVITLKTRLTLGKF
jgi:hypothetical protein